MARCMRTCALVAILLRVFIALSTRTFFQPDEYFQALEVAHQLVFGYGHLTWEWRASRPIRSIIYPLLNAPVYWLAKIARLDDTVFLIAGPKVLHGVLGACTDIWVAELAQKVLGERYVTTAVFLSLTSFFHALSLTRSMSNSLETSLATIALSYFPWDPERLFDRRGIRKAFVFAALACSIRATNAVIWVYMLAVLIWRLRTQIWLVLIVVLDVVGIGLVILDSIYYGQVTFTPLNFLLTNLSSVSLFYGSSDWHYYLSQGLPLLCTTSLPFVLHGAWLALGPTGTPASRTMLGLVTWTLTIYSLAGHKEWRFLHPLLPLLHILASKSLVDLYYASERTAPLQRPLLPIRFTHLCMLLITVPAAIYVLYFHGEPQISVMHYLRNVPPGELESLGFLMPCHSTPWQAYLHKSELADPGRMWALGCEPPLSNDKDVTSSYRDQTDIFYQSPTGYLKERFPYRVDPTFPPSPFPSSIPGVTRLDDKSWRHEWPKYLVMFGALSEESEVRTLLLDRGYREVWARNTGWEGDSRRRGGVRVWKFKG
ncbi:glycosyltransferase family 22 protein [Gloeophyllum trabeum ATCC 11539]|uniref:Mannosyltransferase n=1 Tax=Gloeophyllum trabeum (strain ATCC 11539 / FP-39264 / Madison 617) TaxID=670483 RepID=S7QF63_GLOTA|nr:glycosyltransferase family 22 protein [Gloeophyllum trabeum ATCC 11539]EPQ57997.1 glycosyltransferase family 22 protein [Gloeophyllum trabeum ATCC 11539]